jgi:hypothetical protein
LRGEEDAPRKNPSSSISLSLPSWNRPASGKSLARAFASQKRRLQLTLLCSVLTPRAAAASLGQRCHRRRAIACTRAGEANTGEGAYLLGLVQGRFFALLLRTAFARCLRTAVARCLRATWPSGGSHFCALATGPVVALRFLLRARDRPSGGSALSEREVPGLRAVIAAQPGPHRASAN